MFFSCLCKLTEANHDSGRLHTRIWGQAKVDHSCLWVLELWRNILLIYSRSNERKFSSLYLDVYLYFFIASKKHFSVENLYFPIEVCLYLLWSCASVAIAAFRPLISKIYFGSLGFKNKLISDLCSADNVQTRTTYMKLPNQTTHRSMTQVLLFSTVDVMHLVICWLNMEYNAVKHT